MSTTWVKSSLTTTTTSQDGNKLKRTFNNLRSDATAENIASFGDILAILTGLSTEAINLTIVSSISK
ncbi:hypothetical protein [Liquorilactobacillus vini]|uniref:DUF1659 domain-containing protein n=1 Tax=Liquorilactobacillus vini DSM 20605 TaxID=1133569 RepID=A0A0R2CCW4_9LACO|nr:hypothetical protein [Liquorilactobacillus vini]KRM89544.1 hypothetical protein FD21_GL001402 [Liquorilactobacillus vini DSM 20605]